MSEAVTLVIDGDLGTVTIDNPPANALGDAVVEGLRGAIAEARFPSIAVIEGVAFGGGLELALACTMRVAAVSSRLGLPETRLGLIPAACGTQLLPRVVGRARAIDLMLTGRPVSGDEAKSIGLIDRLVDDGSAEVAGRQLAEELASRSLPALRAVLRRVDASFDNSYEEGLVTETEEFRRLLTGDETAEGLAAFLEKRPARFSTP